jgi:hypothetical protein
MNARTRAPNLDVVVATLIERLPVEVKLAKHEAPDGSAHKLRAVIKTCGRALVELENAVLRHYALPLAASDSRAADRAVYADMVRHFDPLVSACTDLIRSEIAQIHGLDSLPFVQGLFETKRLSVLAAIRLQVIGAR